MRTETDCHIRSREGITLIEVLVVVAIVGILATVALALYDRSVEKAKAVEAEIVLAEIARLEQLYYSNKGVYSEDLAAIGFSPVPALKYYSIGLHVFNGGETYQGWALPLGPSANQTAHVLTRTADGQVTVRDADPATLPAQSGMPSGGSGHAAPAAAAETGVTPGSGRVQSASGCQAGGDATVAADGRLDMNFCFKSINERNK